MMWSVAILAQAFGLQTFRLVQFHYQVFASPEKARRSLKGALYYLAFLNRSQLGVAFFERSHSKRFKTNCGGAPSPAVGFGVVLEHKLARVRPTNV
jgi:hypothetical protein